MSSKNTIKIHNNIHLDQLLVKMKCKDFLDKVENLKILFINEFWSLNHLSTFPNLTRLNLSDLDLSNDILMSLLNMPNLLHLSIINTILPVFPELTVNWKSLKTFTFLNNQGFESLNCIGNLPSLEALYISGNAVVYLPKKITNWKNLKILDLSSASSLISIDQLGNLPALEDLNLSNCKVNGLPLKITNWNNLKHLDISHAPNIKLIQEIAQISSLESLKMSNSGITRIPNCNNWQKLHTIDISKCSDLTYIESSLSFPALEHINLSMVSLSDLPFNLENNKNIKSLDLSHCSNLISFLKLVNLPNLEYLDLSYSQFSNLPVITNWKNLKYLNLSFTPNLTSIAHLNNLPALKTLNLTSSGILELPSAPIWGNLEILIISEIPNLLSIENLGPMPLLKELKLSNLSIDKLPESASSYTKLTSLIISKCENLKSLGTLPRMSKLEEFSLSGTSITNISEIQTIIKNHKTLSCLDLSNGNHNYINLSFHKLRLSKLILSGLLIKNFPQKICTLTSLTFLDLSDNQIEYLPWNILDLNNLVNLRILNNPLQLTSQGPRLGLDVLIHRFSGINFDYSQNNFRNSEEIDFFKNYDLKPLHWNTSKLKTLKVAEPKKHIYSCTELKVLWTDVIWPSLEVNYKGKNIKNHYFTEYLEYISGNYKNSEKFAFVLSNKQMNEILDYLEAIFVTILETKDLNLTQITNAFLLIDEKTECIDRQINELRAVYHFLIGIDNLEISLKTFIESYLAQQKENIFNLVALKYSADKNVHALDHWRIRYAEELGFDYTHDSPYRADNIGIYNAQNFSTLVKFFEEFTPESIIESLTEVLNETRNVNKPIFCEACMIIESKLPESVEKRRFYKNDVKDFTTDQVEFTSDFIEFLLIDFEILIKKS